MDKKTRPLYRPVIYTSMKKDIETINKRQEEMKNTISQLKNTIEGIKGRLDEQRTT